MRAQRMLVCAMLLAPLLGIVAHPAMAAGTLAPVTLTNDGYIPRTDGESVVYTAHPPGAQAHGEIFVTSVGGTVAQQLAPSAAEQDYPDISDGIVVWAEADTRTPCDGCPYDIRGKNLRTGELLDIASTPDNETVPVISGQWVAWIQLDADNVVTLRARDLSSMAPPVIVATLDGTSSRRPAIDGDRLVWAVTRTTADGQLLSDRLYTARIGEEPQLLAENTDFYLGDYDVAGDIVVYGAETSSAVNQPIHVRDVAQGTDETLPVKGVAPATDGRYVFWETDPFTATSALQGWDRATDSLWTAIAWPALRSEQSMGGGALVWQAGGGDDGTQNVVAARVADLLPSAGRAESSVAADATWYPATAHSLSSALQRFWEANGALSVFGYPLTEEFSERNVDTGSSLTTQYLERQRFEAHPENAGTPYEVELGRLGAELLQREGWLWTAFPQADPSAPHYVPETGHAIAPQFWDYWSGHGLELGDPGVSYRESVALFGYPLSEPMLETNADGDTVLTQYFERAVFEYHPENAGTAYTVLLRRLGAEALAARGW